MDVKTPDELYRDALSVSLRYITHRDRTEREVINRLEKDGHPKSVTDRVLSFLREQGYVNDKRYTEYYIVCYKDKRSTKRIRQELKNKGIEDELLDEVMKTTDLYTSEAAHNALKKQLLKRGIYDMEKISYEDKNKIMAALFRQGYSAEEIMNEMDRMLTDSNQTHSGLSE